MESATGARGASSITYDEIARPPGSPAETQALRECITRSASVSATPRVSVVIPTLNEAENLPHVFERSPRAAEVILVDGNSTDGTLEVARAVAIRADRQQVPRGKGDALRCGFEAPTATSS